MFHYGSVVENVYIGESVRAAVAAHEQRVTLRVVAAAGSLGGYLHQSAVRVLGISGRNTLRDNGRRRVLAEMYHLGARVGLLAVAGHGHGVKLAARIVALEYT